MNAVKVVVKRKASIIFPRDRRLTSLHAKDEAAAATASLAKINLSLGEEQPQLHVEVIHLSMHHP